MFRQPFQRDVDVVLVFAGDDVDTDFPISQGLQTTHSSLAGVLASSNALLEIPVSALKVVKMSHSTETGP